MTETTNRRHENRARIPELKGRTKNGAWSSMIPLRSVCPMGNPSGEERRKYRRIETDQVISFAPVGMPDLMGVGRDLSIGGIRFEAVSCGIELGAVLRVAFNVGDQTVVAVGRVAWIMELDPMTLDVGLEFIEIDPQAVEMLDDVTAAEAG